MTRQEIDNKIQKYKKIKSDIMYNLEDCMVTEVEDGYTQEEIDKSIFEHEFAKRIVQWQIEALIKDWAVAPK